MPAPCGKARTKPPAPCYSVEAVLESATRRCVIGGAYQEWVVAGIGRLTAKK